MCGIVGYVGSQDATSIIVERRRRLEYRGYDSAGLAVDEELTRAHVTPGCTYSEA